ncbi:sensor histidine kinase [Massilia soli]|uniref:Histidine kinase n=1 Tax=Massilia soli TaxID=2792854 RepID=A0ABS7SQM2_9BURK|nr:histidine kinase [Massilia soli]MBZ2208242.1 histidine kinase [Massilia soli]
MHPTRTRAVVAIGWLLFWVLMVSVAVQDYVRDGGTAIWQPLVWESSSMVTATVLVLLQHRASARFNHLLATPWRWFAIQALWLPVYWIAFVPLAFGLRHAAYALAGAQYQHEPWLDTFFYESLRITVFAGMFTLIRFGILSYHELLEEKLRAEKSRTLMRQAQLQRLTQQMQPHFLFNALNTVSSLMRSDVDKADATLIQLAEVLRATLDAGEQPETTLAAELRLVRAYAREMEERFAGRVALEWDIAEDALVCNVPVMSVQPLLENVFKHTVELRRQPTGIVVRALCQHGRLLVSVTDDGGVLPADLDSGTGLRNLRQRLAVLYGDSAVLTLEQLAPAGVRAEMRLPCAC